MKYVVADREFPVKLSLKKGVASLQAVPKTPSAECTLFSPQAICSSLHFLSDSSRDFTPLATVHQTSRGLAREHGADSTETETPCCLQRQRGEEGNVQGNGGKYDLL